MKTNLFKKKHISFPRVLSSRFLSVLVVTVALFNFLATKVLPRDVFLVFAADINVNTLVSLANSERSSRGLGQLTVDSRLTAAAYAKGSDMIAKGYWAHYGPNGESPWQFILTAGYDYLYAGENLAKDFSSAAPIHSAWMASPTHKNNIINPNFENIGIAAITGEFQGKETTIVVQMFGKLQQSISQPPPAGEETSELPITGEEEELQAPVITEPETGDILDTGAFDIRGTAKDGENVQVFDNNELIGETEILNAEFDYKQSDPYADGAHSFRTKAYNSQERFSPLSNIVDVTVDTISPLIVKVSATFEYSEIGSDFRNFVFSVQIEDNPINVKGEYEGKDIIFTLKNEKWECVLAEMDDEFSEFKIIATDTTGNAAEITFSSEEMNYLASAVLLDSEISLGKWLIENIGSRIFTRSLRGQINFIITLIMIILLASQQVILARTGLTAKRGDSMLHLAVFAIVLFVGLLGGGGEIL